MNSGKVFVRLTTALIAAGIANACTADRGVRDISGPRASLVDQARVSGITRDSIAVGSWAGSGPAQFRAAAVVSFDAGFEGGRAVTDSGAIVATSHGLRAARSVAFTDREGHRNELMLTSDAPGSPVSRVRHFRDGAILAELAYAWDPAPGGWLLRDKTLTVYSGGAVLAMSHRTVAGTEVSRPDPARSPVGPSRMMLYDDGSCLDKDIIVGVAASAVAASGLAMAAAPTPATWLVFCTALAAYDRAVDDYVNCLAARA